MADTSLRAAENRKLHTEIDIQELEHAKDNSLTGGDRLVGEEVDAGWTHDVDDHLTPFTIAQDMQKDLSEKDIEAFAQELEDKYGKGMYTMQ